MGHQMVSRLVRDGGDFEVTELRNMGNIRLFFCLGLWLLVAPVGGG